MCFKTESGSGLLDSLRSFLVVRTPLLKEQLVEAMFLVSQDKIRLVEQIIGFSVSLLRGGVFLEFSVLWTIRSLLQRYLKSPPILEGLQQLGGGCDGREQQAVE